MPRVRYAKRKNFAAKSQRMIDHAVAIAEEYAEQNLNLTLRQMHYQLVARGYAPNTQQQYNSLSGLLNDARMDGQLDWHYLTDRTRNRVRIDHRRDAKDALRRAGKEYRIDLWKHQPKRVWVWVEKDAAIGVIESVCEELDVPYFATRGYSSVSEIWSAAQDARGVIENGQSLVILYLGDHDPSGLDIDRDAESRMKRFLFTDWYKVNRSHFSGSTINYSDIRTDMAEQMGTTKFGAPSGSPFTFERIALTKPQIDLYAPPPNPAKQSDSRFRKYVEETGLHESWELDALEPRALQSLIAKEIRKHSDLMIRDNAVREQEQTQKKLNAFAKDYDKLSKLIAED